MNLLSPANASTLGAHIANPINFVLRSLGMLSLMARLASRVSEAESSMTTRVNGSVIIATPSTEKPEYKEILDQWKANLQQQII